MMKASRIRNLFAVFAIVLTTFMITTVLSLGINYMENMKLMQVRTAGTTANASLAMPTEKQEQQIKNLEYVKTVGTQYMVGSVAEKNDEGRDLSIALSYYDTTEWDKHYKETIKDIEGKYPSNENEIMLSKDALSQLGMKEPKLNMELCIRDRIIYTSFLGCCVWAAVCITWRTTFPLRLGAVLLLHIQAMAEQYTVEIMIYRLICVEEAKVKSMHRKMETGLISLLPLSLMAKRE